ncbi:glycoside hydrolase family 76 protein [Xylariaceae sp. FL0255]|nr:glycoside hydrolase family 76 protein [Xylariaceae sp. FL0255]
MVSSSWVGSLAARASPLFVISTHSIQKASSTYDDNAVAAIHALQSWYDESTGLWDTTGWWNSANALTTLADYALLNPSSAQSLGIPGVASNTYTQAQTTAGSMQVQKVYHKLKGPISTYVMSPSNETDSDLSTRGYNGFLDDFYDDEGWWALALIRSYDMTVALGSANEDYLNTAASIFADMQNGASSCGGIYWGKQSTYTNAIANELFLKVAASLANRISSQKSTYLDVANKQWTWFKNSGLINSDNLINDGLTDDCTNNGEQTWTYNQGVILGALVELHKAGGDSSLLAEATAIATAAITTLQQNGILYEGCEPNCGADGDQFKGVFMRNLAELQKVAPQDTFSTFLFNNANSIWSNNQKNNQLGPTWPGPYDSSDITAGTQSSALDALVGAVYASS